MAEIIQSTTQQFLDIHDITNNLVIMKDGTVSVIITVDAMNFGLLAEEEQDAVMYAYAGLLNSLNYPVQIVIHSQTKDVTSYLQLLKDQENEAETDVMRKRIRLYREFVSNLIHERNVLDKKFYVVIPANAIELGLMGASTVLPGQNKFDISSVERSILLERALNILEPRRDHLIAQFARIGLYSRQLATQEIIQLFYVRYNPEATEGQQIAESNSYTSPLVQASVQGNFMMSDTTQPPAMPPTDPMQQAQSTAPTGTQPAPLTTDTPAPQPAVSPVDSLQNVLGTQPTPAMPSTPSQPAMPATSTMDSAAPEPAASAPAPAAMPPVEPVATPAPPVSPTAAPAAADPLSSMPPTVTPAVATPAVPTVEQPAAAPQSLTASPAPATQTMDEAAIQADLDATLKQLGGTVPTITEPAATPTNEPVVPQQAGTSDQNKTDDLPPLPEI